MLIDSLVVSVRAEVRWMCSGSREQVGWNAPAGSSRIPPTHRGKLQCPHLNYSSQSNRDIFSLLPDEALCSRELCDRKCH